MAKDRDGHYITRAAKSGDNYLAAEVRENGQIVCEWPKDPLVAQRLFLELEYQFKLAHIEGAANVRAQVQDKVDASAALVQPATLDVLNGIKRHQRS